MLGRVVPLQRKGAGKKILMVNKCEAMCSRITAAEATEAHSSPEKSEAPLRHQAWFQPRDMIYSYAFHEICLYYQRNDTQQPFLFPCGSRSTSPRNRAEIW